MIEYYTWSNTAENISYTGVLLSETETHVVLLTKFGEFTIPKDDGNTFTEASEVDYKFATKPVVEVKSTEKKQTKTSIAKAAIEKLTAEGHTKEQIIAHLQLLLNITKSNASIYYSK